MNSEARAQALEDDGGGPGDQAPVDGPDRAPARSRVSSPAASLISLALPLATIQVGLMFMGVVDTAMVGRISADALAAVAIAGVYYFAISTIGMGCLWALDPVVAQAHGAGDHEAVARGLQRGLLIALIVTVPTTVLLLPVESVLRWFEQPEAVIPLASGYMVPILGGIFPFFGFIAIRQTLQALGRVRALLYLILGANLLNALLNWMFIFGRVGAPRLGVTGAALATTLSRWAMFLGLLAGTWTVLRPYLRPWRSESWALVPLGRMFRIGLPIGFQILFEYGVFGLVGLLLGRIGSTALAGHQIALNLASITFMVPLGIAGAAAVLVGRAIGQGDPLLARRLARAAILVGVGFMTATGLAFITLPRALAGLYTADQAVLAMAGALIPLAGAFQIFDGSQAVNMGILRGIGDTRVPVLINIVGYYALGLPVGLWLGYERGFGPTGFWWGLVLGLAAVAAILTLRVRYRMRRALVRLDIEAGNR